MYLYFHFFQQLSDNEIINEEVIDLIQDLNDDERSPGPRQLRIRQQQRLVPRTRASERVRMNTQRLQQNTMVYTIKYKLITRFH